MRRRGKQTLIWRVLGGSVVSVLLLAGCASVPALRPEVPVPPSALLEGGNYSAFLAENQQRFEQCAGGSSCESALFNLGFVYGYPQSPYYNPAQAVPYFDELVRKYPHTSWAYTGRAWSALLRENLVLAEKQRQLQQDLRTKEDAIRTREDAIRTREGTIRSLKGRIDRARELDIQLDKKERELLR